MKYALVDGVRSEAFKGGKGRCPVCDSVVIAHCGDTYVDHWAHKSRRDCDAWWENEGPWHRGWKNLFPADWQEIVFHSDTGEKHIADIKTANDWVIEFQHSFLDPRERHARTDFYKKITWVVDGTRRKTDIKQFGEVVDGQPILGTPQFPFARATNADRCRLLREWSGLNVPVFFDFGDARLWCLIPGSSIDSAFVMACSRQSFVVVHRSEDEAAGSQFDSFMHELGSLIRDLKTGRLALRRPSRRPSSRLRRRL